MFFFLYFNNKNYESHTIILLYIYKNKFIIL